jgi:hypothetical protein
MRNATAAVLLATTLAGCGLDRFDVDFSSSTTVPGDPLGGAILDDLPFGGEFAGVNVLEEEELRDAGVDRDDIDSAKLRSMRLEVTDGEPLPGWLDEVAFYVEADGQPRRLVASRTGIGDLPAGTTSIDLDVENVELKPYVIREMTISAEANGGPPTEDTTIRAVAVVRVDANVSSLF